MQKHLKFVNSSEFLHLQRIVPLNKVLCFRPYFHFVRKYRPLLASCEPRTVFCPGQSIFKVLSIPSAELTVYRVNSLLPTDFAALASQYGPLTDKLELQTFLALVSVNGNDSNRRPGL